jgi:hypothetical protein
MEPHLFSRKLAAQALSLSIRSIDYLVSDGHLKTVGIGSKRMIPRDQIIKFARNGLSSPIAGGAE